jgi:hypothetical protein
LSGDTDWRLPEVRRLMELHTLVAIRRQFANGLDTGATLV